MKVPFSIAFLCVSLILTVNNIPKLSIASAAPGVNRKQAQSKLPAFDVNVTLSEKAQRRLETAKETIVVSVYVYGEPKKNSSVKLNEVGMVDLANQQIELPKPGKAIFNNLLVPTSKLNQLVSKDYNVNVNVFSGRRSTENNLLSCDFFDDRITKIKPGIALNCKLIEE